MNKLFLAMIIALLLSLFSCSEDDNPVAPPTDQSKERIYLFNGLGDFGTLSRIQDGLITNSLITLGKYPNDIKYSSGLLYVLNSGAEGAGNIKIINESTMQDVGSLEMMNTKSNPWKMSIGNGKIYVTSLNGPGVEVWSVAEKKYLKTIAIPDLIPYSGTTSAIIVNNKLFVSRGNYSANEKIFVVDINADTVVTSFTSGVNSAAMLLDKEGELHILFTGDRANIGGYVKTFDTSTYLMKDSIYLGSQPGAFCMAADGEVFVSISGLNADWTGFGGVMRYNSTTNLIINSSVDLFYSNSSSGIMDIYISTDKKIYLPLFNENKLVVLNSSGTVTKEYTTGNGPQGLCYVKTTGK